MLPFSTYAQFPEQTLVKYSANVYVCQEESGLGHGHK